MFPSYIENPQNCKFEGQDLDENILLLLRAHPITNFSWIIPAVIVFFIPFIIFRVAPAVGINLSFIPQNVLIAGLVIFYLIVLVIVFEGFLYWYFNVTLVTTKKVVDINFESLLYKGVDLAPLNKIEEADSTVAGFLGTTFNYGDVSIQTAGAKVAIVMKNVSKPAHVADLVLDLAQKNNQPVPPGG